MKVFVAAGEGVDGGVGTRDEVVVDDVGVALAGAVTGNVAAAAAPVVDEIVLEVVHTLDLGVAGVVVDVQVPQDADAAVGLHEAAARVRPQTLGDDGVLHRDAGAVAADGEGLVAAPADGDVVEDHVGPGRDGDGVGARVAPPAHADADVPHDGVVGVGP